MRWTTVTVLLAVSACGKVDGGEDLGVVVSVPLPADELDAAPPADADTTPGAIDAAPPPPPPVRKWYKTSDGVEHEGAPPGFAPDDGDGASVGSGTSDAVSYVHVDWCDKPGVEATVCKWDLPTTSTRAQAWDECTEESKDVCGTIGYPFVLFY
jgi:hypothetical protein